MLAKRLGLALRWLSHHLAALGCDVIRTLLHYQERIPERLPHTRSLIHGESHLLTTSIPDETGR